MSDEKERADDGDGLERGDGDGRGDGVEYEEREDSDEDDEASEALGERVAEDGCNALRGVSVSAPGVAFSNVFSCDRVGVVA